MSYDFLGPGKETSIHPRESTDRAKERIVFKLSLANPLIDSGNSVLEGKG